MSCETCKFWDGAQDRNDTGKCRRLPPVMIHDPDATTYVSQTHFPVTYHDEWCGEHQPKSEPKPQSTGIEYL